MIIHGISRRIYNRAEYFHSFDDLTFFTRFRVTKPTAIFILNEVEAEIEHPYDLNNSVAPMNQLLIFLRLCATGNHLASIGDFGGVHLSTVSRITKRVGRALAGRSRQFIRMPEMVEDINQGQLEFYEIARFPRVIGAVDGTHIRIQSPGGDDAEIFRNRKGYFSLNVQTVASAILKILDLVVRWPGSTHDSTIFNNSRLKQRFENNSFPNSVLLALPEEDPIITGVEMEYQIGDEINLNCTSGKSHPASILHWYINEQRIQTKEALISYPNTHHPKDLISSTLGLTFKLSNHHFRGGSMRVKCVASIAPILYQSDKESVVQTQSVPIREALLLVKSSSRRTTASLLCISVASYLILSTT